MNELSTLINLSSTTIKTTQDLLFIIGRSPTGSPFLFPDKANPGLYSSDQGRVYEIDQDFTRLTCDYFEAPISQTFEIDFLSKKILCLKISKDTSQISLDTSKFSDFFSHSFYEYEKFFEEKKSFAEFYKTSNYLKSYVDVFIGKFDLVDVASRIPAIYNFIERMSDRRLIRLDHGYYSDKTLLFQFLIFRVSRFFPLNFDRFKDFSSIKRLEDKPKFVPLTIDSDTLHLVVECEFYQSALDALQSLNSINNPLDALVSLFTAYKLILSSINIATQKIVDADTLTDVLIFTVYSFAPSSFVPHLDRIDEMIMTPNLPLPNAEFDYVFAAFSAAKDYIYQQI